MFKIILLLTFILIAISQAGGAQLRMPQPIMVGGFNQAASDLQISADQLEKRARIDALARSQFESKNNGEELGPIKKIETQIVAGINYKISYIRNNGQTVTIIVYEDLGQELRVTSISSSNNAN